MFSSFSDNESSELAIQVLKLASIESAKISELSLINSVGISLSSNAFDVHKFLISFKTFFSINKLKVKTWFWIAFCIYCKNATVFPLPNNGSNYSNFFTSWIIKLKLRDIKIFNYIWKKISLYLRCFLIIFCNFVFYNDFIG